MKIIKESLDNIKTELDNKDVVATIDVQHVDAEKEDREKDEMMHGAEVVKNTKAFLGAKNQPFPKEPEMARVNLEESLFEDYPNEDKTFTLQSKVRDYVEANYPEEYQLDLILPDVTFAEVIKGMKQGKDLYELCSVNGERFDTAVREEIFIGLEEVSHKPYNYFYQLWLHGPKNEEYDPKEEDKAEAEGATIGTAAGVVAGQAIPGPMDDIALGALGGAIGGVGGKHLYRKSSGYYDTVDEEYDSSSPAVKKIHELLNTGMSADLILRMCLRYMSNDQLIDMLNKNGIELDESIANPKKLNITEDTFGDDKRDMTVYDLWTLVYDDLVGDLGGHPGDVIYELPDNPKDRYGQNHVSIDGNDIIVHVPTEEDLAFAYKVADHYGVKTELKYDDSPLTKKTSRYQLRFIIPEDTMGKWFRKRGRKAKETTETTN